MQMLTSAKQHLFSTVLAESSGSNGRVRFTHFVYAIVLTAMVIIGYIWLYTGYQIGLKSNEDFRSLQDSDVILVRDFAQRLIGSIDERDRFLKLVRADDGAAAGKIDLKRYVKLFGDLYGELTVIDASGRVIASTNLAKGTDRSHDPLYVTHRDNPLDSLGIGEPVQVHRTGQWMMHITRRISSRRDKFAGVVELDFAVEQLPALYHQSGMPRSNDPLGTNDDGIATGLAPAQGDFVLMRMDRSVSRPNDIDDGKNSSVATELVGGEPRLLLSRILHPYPILLSVTVPESDLLLAEASARRASYLMYACIPTALIFILMFFVFRTLRRQYVVLRKYDALRRRANDANQQKSRFLTTVVHELRSPLSGVHGYAELVRDTSIDAQSREFGALIYQSATDLNGLLSTLFDLARIEAGKVVLLNEGIETVAFFEYIGLTHQINAHKKQLSLQMTLAPDLPVSFVCDRLRLSQIINNLIDNAIKFTETGGVTMSVELDQDQLSITVLDTGQGIPESELRHLFEYFYQTELVRVRTGPGLGLGLGLSLTKDFTDLIGGTIRIDSEVGVGTAVYLRVPLEMG
ncbi:ATP-binding protein [Glaciimonas sp. PAMC28666]|uniref:sensor histidine kinase n=1 Tax=Glaciimonas sp. PAMC28666 TaxID=2807626 RepID=UPI0019639499|nr:ATP-binding protein [Glaciimonas sp. PAMC28666]QRX83131.1 hypothetical protein JQN73_02240 [Glaciimonas sp. PAMC28666]